MKLTTPNLKLLIERARAEHRAQIAAIITSDPTRSWESIAVELGISYPTLCKFAREAGISRRKAPKTEVQRG